MANVNESTSSLLEWPANDVKESLGPVSDHLVIGGDVIRYVYTINLAIICGVGSVFGTITNMINMKVFLVLGFKETINISLFALAISDTCSLIALLWISVCYNPYFMYSDLPVITIELQHKTGGWTHLIFTRVTGFLTVFITLERCLCIAFPLKIKRILTPLKVKAIVIGIYVFTIATMMKNYFVSYLDWKWVPSMNRTMLGIIYLENQNAIEQMAKYMQMVYPVISFSSVTICTAIFVWKLTQRGKWLHTVARDKDKESSSVLRDRQIVKMVVCVAVIFIASYVPSLILFTVLSNLPEMNIGRKYQNFFILFYSLVFPMDALNSSVNIFIYYKMMSKYKAIFKTLFLGSTNAT